MTPQKIKWEPMAPGYCYTAGQPPVTVPHFLRIYGREEDGHWDYEVDHVHDKCIRLETYRGDEQLMVEWQCQVQWEIDNDSLNEALESNTFPPGLYTMVAWVDTIRGPDFTEYDSGLEIVEVEDGVAELAAIDSGLHPR